MSRCLDLCLCQDSLGCSGKEGSAVDRGWIAARAAKSSVARRALNGSEPDSFDSFAWQLLWCVVWWCLVCLDMFRHYSHYKRCMYTYTDDCWIRIYDELNDIDSHWFLSCLNSEERAAADARYVHVRHPRMLPLTAVGPWRLKVLVGELSDLSGDGVSFFNFMYFKTEKITLSWLFTIWHEVSIHVNSLTQHYPTLPSKMQWISPDISRCFFFFEFPRLAALVTRM